VTQGLSIEKPLNLGMIDAILLRGPNDHSFTKVPFSWNKNREAVIRVKCSGICGTDLKIFKGLMGDAPFPFVPGHEWSGLVEQAPAGYEHLIGKLVVLDNLQCCKLCVYCQSGYPNLCNSLVEPGISTNGAFATHVKAFPEHLHVVPDHLSAEEACMLEPLAVAVYALRRLPVHYEDRVLIIGGGTIGLLIGQLARLSGAKEIILLDHHHYRLEIGQSLFADRTCNPLKVDLDKAIGSELPNKVFEVTGSSEGFQNSVKYAKPGGSIAVVGYAGPKQTSISTADIMCKLLTLIGVLSPTNSLGEAIDIAVNRRIDLSVYLDHTYPLKDFDKAFKIAEKRLNGCLKAMLIP